MITLNRVLAGSAIAFLLLAAIALGSGSEQTIVTLAPWAGRALLVFGIASVIWLWRKIAMPAKASLPSSSPSVEAPMDIWHATVWAKGTEQHEDRVGLDAAKDWVARTLKDLGYAREPEWQSAQDVCTATIPPDAAAMIRRRVPG